MQRSPTPLTGLFPEPFTAGSSSFVEVLRSVAPDGLPGAMGGTHDLHDMIVDGTTVVALVCADGVVMAGDRRATAGNMISKKDMRKVFPADRHSAVAISGAAGPAMDMARVFATELEHYEKIEGELLSLDGKANKLAGMVRSNLPLAMQGLVVVPLFCGVDHRNGEGRIFDYDPAGGRYLATSHAAAGSGSIMARQTMKRLHDTGSDMATATTLAIEALYDAADDDSATGGPDQVRGIYPIVATITLADGYAELSEDEVSSKVDTIVDARRGRPSGHAANI